MDSTTTIKTLDGLPSELVCNIAARLHADDISSFRLVSRSLEQKSFHEFATEYFSEKCFMFTTESLKVLVHISNSARLRPFLRHVHFMTAIFSDRAYQCINGCNCTWQPSVKQKEAWRGYIEDQSSLKDTGRDKEMLTEAFANLPNLTTLSIDDSPSILGPDVDYRGNSKVPRLCGRGPMLAPHSATKEGFKEYDAFFQRVWEVVLQSIQHSTALTRFATHLGKSSNGVPISLLDIKKFPKSIPALKGLTTILLRIRSYKRSGCTEDKGPKDVSKRELKSLQRFAGTLTSLETLDLAFDSTRATGLYLLAFTSGLELGKIKACYLDGIAIAASGLTTILESMTSLKDLRLIFASLTKGSWLAILKLLQKMTGHLEHLHLMYLLEGGRKAYFLKQIDDDGLDPFEYGFDEAFDDYGEQDDTDDDLPPLEPGDGNALGLEDPTPPASNFLPPTEDAANDSDDADASAPANPPAMPSATPGVTLSTGGHSAVDHVRPGEERGGERGYYVCVQGNEIERQLPVFIQEYNLGIDVADDLPPGLGGIGLMPPGMGGGGPNFNNVLNALGAALGVPGVHASAATGANAGGLAGVAVTPAAGLFGTTISVPFHAAPFGPAPQPPSTHTPTNPVDTPSGNSGSASSGPNFTWNGGDGDEWEDEEENDITT